MNAIDWLAVGLVGGLFVYLLFALFFPERFA